MSSIKVGTSNLVGSGSAENLSWFDELLSGAGNIVTPFSSVSEDDSSITATAAFWNAPGAKEVKIDAVNRDVFSRDFVDVDVNLEGSDQDVSVQVLNSKRGNIDTGSGDDNVEVQVYSNGAGWSNKFDVNTGDGNDYIVFKDGQNSQYTSLNIDAGNGNDTINLMNLEASASNVTRVIDGGNGNDLIIGSAGNENIYGGHGADFIMSGAGNDRVWGGHGNDAIATGAGNDIIHGGQGHDSIYAGQGNDEVFFDQADTIVNGGAGFDSLVVQGNADVSKAEDFEAIIANANTNSVDSIVANLQDGLVVMLGNDLGDNISFDPSTIFTLLGQTFGEDQLAKGGDVKAELLDLVNAQGFNGLDLDSLNGYQANTGEIIWSDVNLLA